MKPPNPELIIYRMFTKLDKPPMITTISTKFHKTKYLTNFPYYKPIGILKIYGIKDEKTK